MLFAYIHKMKPKTKILLLVLILVVLYVLYIFNSTGFFRTIENTTVSSEQVEMTGAEDMQIRYEDNFMLFSSDDRASRRDGDTIQGHLYFMDLLEENSKPIQLTKDLAFPFFPHGISMFRKSANEYVVYVVNHVDQEHSIEVFKLFGDSLVHKNPLKDPAMISPNDVVAIGENEFYFTNDHGKTKGIGKVLEEYVPLAGSNVIYFDGNSYQEVADRILYANGINFDDNRNLLFVASSRGFEVKVYNVGADRNLQFIEDIDCATGIDNIEFDESGKLWIGCHPSLLAFASYAKGNSTTAPSEVISIDYRGEGDYSIESIYVNDGNDISAASVAAPYQNKLFVGNVMDDHFLILDRN